ncbi:MAG: caspase family protein [Bacteroidota bacterium]
MKTLHYFLLLWIGSLMILTQAQAQTFVKTYGGVNDEHAISVVQCRSGEYALAGFTHSYGSGKSDIWVMKVNRYGEEVWRQYLGGTGADWPGSLIETANGDLVVVGHVEEASGSANAWAARLTSNGNLVWQRSFGGKKFDEAKSVAEMVNGDLVLAGHSQSFGRGKKDAWMLRLGPNGEEKWRKSLGGAGNDAAYDIEALSTGEVMICGFTESVGNGRADMLVMKVGGDGKMIWKRNFGGAQNENGEALVPGPNGTWYVAGWTGSVGKGSLDGSLWHLDKAGKLLWQKTYGATGKDVCYDIGIGPTGDLALVGTSNSFSPGNKELWLLQLDLQGNVIRQKHSNAPKDEYGHALALTHDGGLLVGGSTKSYASSGADMWLIKTDRYGTHPGNLVQDFKGQKPPSQLSVDNIPTPSAPPLEDYNNNVSGKPNLYMLTVGVSRYQDPKANLNFADIDANALVQKFSEMEGVIYERVIARQLLNEDATLVNIRTSLTWLERQATQRDVIMIFLSSHGALDHKGNLYILPHDFNSYNLFATALNIRDLTEGINGVPCKKLILLDACHSGQSGFDMLEFASAKAVNVDEVVRELVEKEPGLTVMTSSSGREYSYENAVWGHGAFTKAILEGLGGIADYNKDRIIRLSELDLFVTERVRALTRGLQHPFTPINLFGDIPIFTLD